MGEVGVVESIGLDRSGRRVRGCVLGNNLLKRIGKDLPGEDLDILLDVAGLGVGERHDQLEELSRLRLALRDSDGAESFEVATDTVLLLNREADGDQGLEQVDAVDRGQEAVVLLSPVDARDNNAVRLTLSGGDGGKVAVDIVSVLASPELDEAAVGLPLFTAPVDGHIVHVTGKLEVGLVQEGGVGVVVSNGGNIACVGMGLLLGGHV